MRLALFFFGAIAVAQPFSFGVKAGVPLTSFVDVVQNMTAQNTTGRFIIGPTVELRLRLGFGIEADALYRHYGFNSFINAAAVFQAPTAGRTGAWEFPLLAKYRFPTRVVRPYVDAGVAWDTLMGLRQITGPSVCFPDQIGCRSITPASPAVNKGTITGFVLGGGVDIHVVVVQISPEIRFTHWDSQHFLDASAGLSSNQNQAEFLVGVTF